MQFDRLRRRAYLSGVLSTFTGLAGCNTLKKKSSSSPSDTRKQSSTETGKSAASVTEPKGQSPTPEPAELRLSNLGVPSPLTEGEKVQVNIEISNIGGQPTESQIKFSIADLTCSKNISVGHDTTKSVSCVIQLDIKPGEYNLSVEESESGAILQETVSVEPRVMDLDWNQLPGPPGGPVTDIDISESDTDWIYSTTKTAGMFVSSEGGSSWVQGLSGMHHRSRVWVNPHDPRRAYTTGNRTENGGRRWYHDGEPAKLRYPPVDPPGNLSHLEWSLSDESTLYAATGQGFYRSFDAGKTWEKQVVIEEDEEIPYIARHPNEEGVIVAAVPSTGIARSVDQGETWSIIPGSKDIPDQLFRGLTYGDPDSGELFFAFNVYGVYRLADGELTKITRDFLLPWWTNQLRMSADRDSLYFIAAPWGDEGGSLANRKLFSYELATGELSVIDTPEKPSAVATHPSDPSILYCGGIRWVFESLNQGDDWTALSDGFVDHYLSTVGVNATKPDTIIPGSICSTGITVSYDRGKTFNWKRSGLRPWHDGKFAEHYVKQVDAKGNFAYATTGAGLLISEDNGVNWRLLDNEFSGQGSHNEGEDFAHLHGLALNPENPRELYVGTGRGGAGLEFDDIFDGAFIWKSEDAGNTWTEVTDGFPKTIDTTVRDIVINPADPNIVYVATRAESTHHGSEEGGRGVGIFKSTNGGATWNDLGTPFSNIHALTIDSADTRILYASTPNNIHRTVDEGRNWESILPYETRALATHPNNSGMVYAGSAKYSDYWDVLLSKDRGETWVEGNLTIQAGKGPETREYEAADIHSDYWNEHGEISSMAIDGENDLLYATTRGAGLWRVDAAGISDR